MIAQNDIKKILITGGSGLVGQAIQNVYRYNENYKMTFLSSKDCNLLDYESTFNTVKESSPDVVIHLAANVGGMYKNMNSKAQMFEDNIIMNHNIVKACFKNCVSQFIGTLSTCIFPDDTTYPINESMLHDGAPHNSNDAYAYAKRMLDVHCRSYNERHGTNYSCIIPTNIYGKNDNYDLEDSHVLPALIHKCYIASKERDAFVVRGTGSALRQFIYAEDLARAIIEMIPIIYQQNIIISPSKEYSIKKVATTIANLFGVEDSMIFDSTYSDGQHKKTADNSKFMSLLPSFKFTKLKHGLAAVIPYFIENYNNLRIGKINERNLWKPNWDFE